MVDGGREGGIDESIDRSTVNSIAKKLQFKQVTSVFIVI